MLLLYGNVASCANETLETSRRICLAEMFVAPDKLPVNRVALLVTVPLFAESRPVK